MSGSANFPRSNRPRVRNRLLGLVTIAVVLAQLAGPVGASGQSDGAATATDAMQIGPDGRVVAAAPVTMNTPVGGGSASVDPTIGGPPQFPPYTAPATAQELPALRTRLSRTLVNADGSFTLEQNGGPINFKDASGQWQPIDLALVEDKTDGYAFRVTADAETLRLGDSNGSLIAMESGDHKVSLSAPDFSAGEIGTGDAADKVTFAGSAGGASVWSRPVADGAEFGAT